MYLTHSGQPTVEQRTPTLLNLELQAVVSHGVGAEPCLQPHTCSPSGKLTRLPLCSCLEREDEGRAAAAIFRAGCHREEVMCWRWKRGKRSRGAARRCPR